MTTVGTRTRTGQAAEVLDLTQSSWTRVNDDILAIEVESFPESIQDSADYLAGLHASPTAIFLGVRVPLVSRIVGYLAADRLERFADIPGIGDDSHFGRRDTMYIASVAVALQWRRRGLGVLLQRDCIDRARSMGLQRTTAHIHHGALQKLETGGRVIRSFSDWYGTGQTFDYVEIIS